MKTAAVSAAIKYINALFVKANGKSWMAASWASLIENRQGYATFRVLRSDFRDRTKDTLGHVVDSLRKALGDGYVRTCTEMTEEYAWHLTADRTVRVWHHKRSGTFIQLVDLGD